MKDLLVRMTLPVFVAAVCILGFYTILFMLLFHVIPVENKDILGPLIGQAGSAVALIVGYWWGSSTGSARKTDMLNILSGAGDGTSTTSGTITTETVITPKAEPTVVNVDTTPKTDTEV